MVTVLIQLMTVAVLLSYSQGEGTEDPTIDVPLKKHINEKAQNLRQMLYKKTLSLAARQSNSKGSTDEILKNIGEAYFIGTISAGTPPQKVNINFDTGSAAMWIKSYKYCEKNKTLCETINTYNRKKSSTFECVGKNFSFNYVAGFVGGDLVRDNVYVAGLKIKKQVFGEATSIDDETLYSGIDGVFGLAYSPENITNLRDVDPPIINMINQGLIKKQIFAFYLTKSNSKKQSLLTFGGVNPKLFTGGFVFTPVVKKAYWYITLDKIIICKTEVGGSIVAVPDSGTNLIAGPKTLMDRINNKLGAIYDPDNGLYLVDCKTVNQLRNVSFVISGQPLVLSADNYIIKVTVGTDLYCISGFYGYEQLTVFILGLPFLETFYTLFDVENKRIGFARAI